MGIFSPVTDPEPEPAVLERRDMAAPALASAPPELPSMWSAHSSKVPSGGRSRGRIAVALGLVLALTAGAAAFLFLRGGTGGGNGVALAMSFQQGKQWHYRMHLAMDFSIQAEGQSFPIKADVAATVVMKVVSVDPAGVATLTLRAVHAKATLNGQRIPLPPHALRQTLRLASDGQVVSGTLPGLTAEEGANLVPGLTQFAPLLPNHPVQPGDTWSREADVPFPFAADGGTLHLSKQVTLVKYQKLGGVRTAVIEEHGTVPLSLTLDVAKALEALGKPAPQLPPDVHPQIDYHGTVTDEGTSWFDPASGTVLSASGHATVDATMTFRGLPSGQPAPDITVSGSVTLDLRDLGQHAGETA